MYTAPRSTPTHVPAYESGVRGTSFREIPLSIKIIHQSINVTQMLSKPSSVEKYTLFIHNYYSHHAYAGKEARPGVASFTGFIP